MGLREIGRTLRLAAIAWWNDDVFRLAASLAFYTTFSLAPMMLLAIAVAGMIFGQEAAQKQLVSQVTGLVGTEGGRFVERMVQGLRQSGGGATAALIGIGSVIFGSTVVLAELQAALNKIWDVKAEVERGMVLDVVRKRILSFVIVLGVGFLLVVSLVIDAVLAGAQEWISASIPLLPWFWQAVNQTASLGITTALFMMIYKVLPDVQLSWRDVFIGALFTAILFSVGKQLIGFYLGRMAVGSAYGAAGSFVVVLIWVYYSALISFFGAEFTHVYAQRIGKGVRPEGHAVRQRNKPDLQ